MKTFDKVISILFNPVFWLFCLLLVIFIYIKRIYFPSAVQHSLDKSKLRYPVGHYLNIADSLDDAMNSNFGIPGTDEIRIFRLLDGLNKDELIQVYNSFGKRVLSDTEFSFLKDKRDLFSWFEEELSGNDLTNLKSLWSVTGLWN